MLNPKSMSSTWPLLVALSLAAPLPAGGCSSDSKGRERSTQEGLLSYGDRTVPGVRHAAHPGLEAPPVAPDGSSATTKEPAARSPRTCDEEALALEAKKELDEMLAEARAGADRPLPPPRPEHVDGRGLGMYLAALGRRKPGLPASARSLRAIRNTRIRFAPDHKADEVGMLGRHSRISTYGFVSRRGCRSGWMALGPHAFLCASSLRADRRPPELLQLPRMKRGRITPGVYGYIRRGGAPAYASRGDAKTETIARRLPGGFFIRFGRFTRIGSRNFWKTTKGLYVPVDRIARHVPSRYHGYLLERDGLKLPVALVRRKGPGGRGVPIYHAPGSRLVVGRLKRYTAVSVLGTTVARAHARTGSRARGRGRARFYRVGRCQWIRARATRLVHQEPPPPGVRAGERWIDVDLSTQTLVAYEGARPVFITLVSTGKKRHETRHGIFRVYWKIAEVDMANEAGSSEEYLAESVPWSMFFWKGQALHCAYWHDDFGRVKSHGCINLSPLDARFLFEWSRPALPRGWLYSWHGKIFPGTTVRIRRRRGERPRLLGLARRFAPAAEVAARDRAFQARVRSETIRLLGGDPEQAPSRAPGSPSSSPAPDMAGARRLAGDRRPRSVARRGVAPSPGRPAPAAASTASRRARGRRRSGRAAGISRRHSGGLVPVRPAPPPPPRR